MGGGMKILLLGVGMQGKAALQDLAKSTDIKQVIAADINYRDLQEYILQLETSKAKAIKLDVRDDQAVITEMRQVDAVIILLPQEFREKLVKLAIESGVHLIETSYSLPTYADLGIAAKSKGLAILPECGLDPGIDKPDPARRFMDRGRGEPREPLDSARIRTRHGTYDMDHCLTPFS